MTRIIKLVGAVLAQGVHLSKGQVEEYEAKLEDVQFMGATTAAYIRGELEQGRQFDALTLELAALKDRESLVAEVYVECHRTPSDGPIAESERKLREHIINLIHEGA